MKILIVGIVASGKTTMAKILSKCLDIEHYEIDSIVHDDFNKKKRSNYEQQKIIKKINENKSWILEGTLRKNLYNLLAVSEKVIYIDLPLRLRKRRIVLRFIKQKLGIEKCNYKPTLNMLKMMFKWTNDFEEEKAMLEKRLEKYSEKLICLKSQSEIDNYIQKIKIQEVTRP